MRMNAPNVLLLESRSSLNQRGVYFKLTRGGALYLSGKHDPFFFPKISSISFFFFIPALDVLRFNVTIEENLFLLSKEMFKTYRSMVNLRLRLKCNSDFYTYEFRLFFGVYLIKYRI